MAVHEVRSQAARTDSGVLLLGVDRETMRVEFAGHVLHVAVDRGLSSYGFYLPAEPVWDDSVALSAQELAVVKDAIVEIQRFWGFAVDFHVLGVD
ncbi:hypothetical protein FB565_005458 [Actinoplanes lutulentus]|uniref:Immunity protein 74 of polymorphic toxin system n=1 Tax=Actinoplanes lutulentus TaxID=1287878 RepID=A0A327ZCW3_9ACTN|nr:hypothetical protein [Actinoplanes lutulentus]MBB2945700.1 hypothetical protein [Actinoplanes lutulentus]RAK37749.1 hypothetical protein B0I29_10615 [Actinoplanes lutulentus]